MSDRTARSGFDWDSDQEDLLEPVERQDAEQKDMQSSSWPILLRGHPSLYALGLIFLFALAYEKDVMSQLRSSATVSLGVLDVVAPTPNATALPEGLVVYTPAQAERFTRDLRLADMQTLHGYIARTTADLAMAEPNLRPFYQDAQILLMSELARRGANAS